MERNTHTHIHQTQTTNSDDELWQVRKDKSSKTFLINYLNIFLLPCKISTSKYFLSSFENRKLVYCWWKCWVYRGIPKFWFNFFRYLRMNNCFIVKQGTEFIVALYLNIKQISFSLLMDCYVDFHLGIKWTLFVPHILETKQRWDNTWLDEAVQAYHKFCIVYAYECTKYKDVIFIATETFVFELKLIAGMNCNSWLKSLCIETVLSTNNYLYWAQ